MDAADFDPVRYVNDIFPDESSLVGGKLDAFLTALRRKGATVSTQIAKDVQMHSCQRSQTQQAIVKAKEAIGELFVKIKTIKEKALQSEDMVQEICRDIKSLDFAKRHLTNTITALRQLHMLVSAVDQLQHMASSKQYRDAARLFEAISMLINHFDQYQDVPKIKALSTSVQTTKTQLKDQIFHDFQNIMEQHNNQKKDGGNGDDEDDEGYRYESKKHNMQGISCFHCHFCFLVVIFFASSVFLLFCLFDPYSFSLLSVVFACVFSIALN